MGERRTVDRRRFLAVAAGSVAVGSLAGSAAARPTPTPDGGGSSDPGKPSAGGRPLFLGTYTSADGGGAGLGLARYDAGSGLITSAGVLPGVDNPSYLALAPSGKMLYAVAEQQAGGVSAIAIGDDGALRVLGTRSTGGSGPCHLSVHPGGRHLLSAGYGSGSVAVHPIGADGALGERTDLVVHSDPKPGPGQNGPHAHQIVTAPDGRFVLSVDLGNDTVYTYRLDPAAGTLRQLSSAALRPGAGPRHLTFHPSGAYAYLANELDNTVVVCGYDAASGELRPGTPQSTGTGGGTSYPAQLLVTADGRFGYLANRGHNSITRYAVREGGARLELLDTVPVGGDFPRHIAFSPGGELLFAANQKSGSVTVFRVNGRSGELARVGSPFSAPVPVCVLPL
ncbi:lactonase family protein [Streptomyces sp. H27-D2]|uniref:lactonase family protein n=1 Tax=Streptomyces sp. H27-D2 TaxID=3046304 RepID=UPI002DB842F2|nr:lactonase family protein [Streptomyces sp. H27-D2]MEC4019101.1 lactonase family protein [Streptomyces sp. H27-D2]